MMLLRTDALCLSYEKREVIHNLNLTIDAGECLCVVGSNGSGKSTLVRALVGLKKPSHGTIHYEEGLSCRQIGYMPQQMVAQKDFPALAQEVVLSGLSGTAKLRPWFTAEQKHHAKSAMEQLGIDTLAKRCFRELSGGQQRRVLLARALCATQKLLVLDEPAAGLDEASARELSEQIDTLHRINGIAIILISHDPAEVCRHADKVLQLHAQDGGYAIDDTR